jgi:uncharacterized membrane protein YgdD (TMEM256/DUF423 family)
VVNTGPRWPRVLAALLGFLGVAAGAFGAHGLRGLVAPEQLQTWETAADYQLLHAVALLAVSGWQQSTPSSRLQFWLLWACGLIAAGILLFSLPPCVDQYQRLWAYYSDRRAGIACGLAYSAGVRANKGR